MKRNNIIKSKKADLGLALAMLGLLCMVNVAGIVKADSETPTSTSPISTIDSTSDLGLWTGKDGDCIWKFDLITRTLTISAPAKTSQLSTTPFKKEFNWSDIIEHIVFETPVSLAPDSSAKFADLRSMQDIKGLDQVDTSEVTSMARLFADDPNLTSLDVSRFDTDKVTDVIGMFANIKEVKKIDVSYFDVRKVTRTFGMFWGDTALEKVNLKGWNPKRLEDMANMFRNDAKLHKVDLRGWNMRKIIATARMFKDCPELTYVDLHGWQMANLGDSTQMFYNDRKLALVDLSHFNIHNSQILAEAGNPTGLPQKIY